MRIPIKVRSIYLIAISCLLLPISSYASTYTKTQYPIVLVHGLSGFDIIGGVFNYFHRIPWNLERSGAKVYTPSVSAFNSSEVRGQQLADFLMTLPEDKFNLFGHSQGAPTARVTAALIPHKVASVTSVSGVNLGSKSADAALGRLEPGLSTAITISVYNALGTFINIFSGENNPQDPLASAESLSTAGAQALNQALDFKGVSSNCSSISEDVNIDGNNVKMFSWAGNRRLTNVLDPTDGVLLASSVAFQGEPNDGLVSVCSMRLGRVISTSYFLNHGDTSNQLLGLRGFVNPVSLYRIHANRLKNKNL